MMKKIWLALLLLLLLPSSSFAQSLSLSWRDNSTDENGFRCERSTNGGTFSQVCEVGANVTTWKDTNVTLGVPYCFRVRSFNTAGNSAYSNAPCMTLTADAPDAVLNLTSTTVPETAPTGLVLALSFNEGSGTILGDRSGNNGTGVIVGAAWSTFGKYGNALSFDGDNDVVTVPDSGVLDLTTALTLESWVFPTEAGDWRTVILKEKAGDLVYSQYSSDGGGLPSSVLYVGTTKQYLDGPAPLPLNQWSHLATTYDGSQYRFYINGIQVIARAQTGKLAASTGVLRIGGNSIWGEYFQGRIDEIRIYNRALTPAQIVADMNTPLM